MATAEIEEGPIVVNTPLLISGRAAARLLGIDTKTFQGVVKANSLQTVSTGKRQMFRRPEIERLAGIRETA
jgi:hypothetical protein